MAMGYQRRSSKTTLDILVKLRYGLKLLVCFKIGVANPTGILRVREFFRTYARSAISHILVLVAKCLSGDT